MISHGFTIILGIREKKQYRVPPPEQKKNRVPGTRNSRKPSAASKTEPPNWGGTRLFFFAYRVRNVSFLFFFAYRVRDLEGYVCSGM